MASFDKCCCGRTYHLTDGGGESDHQCPVGKRNLCQECVSKDPYRCMEHGVPTKTASVRDEFPDLVGDLPIAPGSD
jgi:hypothetical protein